MIRLYLKDGTYIPFNMSSKEKEKNLILKFNSKSISETAILDLKKYGKYPLSDIDKMDFDEAKYVEVAAVLPPLK